MHAHTLQRTHTRTKGSKEVGSKQGRNSVANRLPSAADSAPERWVHRQTAAGQCVVVVVVVVVVQQATSTATFGGMEGGKGGSERTRGRKGRTFSTVSSFVWDCE